jgi:hypothetical protein
MKLSFTIRDLLWLTLVVALSVGWLVDNRANQRQSAKEFNALRQRIMDLLSPTTSEAITETSLPPEKPVP